MPPHSERYSLSLFFNETSLHESTTTTRTTAVVEGEGEELGINPTISYSSSQRKQGRDRYQQHEQEHEQEQHEEENQNNDCNNSYSNNSMNSSFSSISCSLFDLTTTSTKQQQQQQHIDTLNQRAKLKRLSIQNGTEVETTRTTSSTIDDDNNDKNNNTIQIGPNMFENFMWDCSTVDGSIHVLFDFLEKNNSISTTIIDELRLVLITPLSSCNVVDTTADVTTTAAATIKTTTHTVSTSTCKKKENDFVTSSPTRVTTNTTSIVPALVLNNDRCKTAVAAAVSTTTTTTTSTNNTNQIIINNATKYISVLYQLQLIGEILNKQQEEDEIAAKAASNSNNDIDNISTISYTIYDVMMCLLLNAYTQLSKDLYNKYCTIYKDYKSIKHYTTVDNTVTISAHQKQQQQQQQQQQRLEEEAQQQQQRRQSLQHKSYRRTSIGNCSYNNNSVNNMNNNNNSTNNAFNNSILHQSSSIWQNNLHQSYQFQNSCTSNNNFYNINNSPTLNGHTITGTKHKSSNNNYSTNNITANTYYNYYDVLINQYGTIVGPSTKQQKQLQLVQEQTNIIFELYTNVCTSLYILQKQYDRRIKSANRRLEV